MLTVDVHTHFLPFDVLAAARHGQGFDGMTAEHDAGQEWLVHRQGFRWPVPAVFYDLTARLESMDQRGIDRAVLSPAPQLFMYWADASEAAGFCRAVNDALAAFAAGSGSGGLQPRELDAQHGRPPRRVRSRNVIRPKC